MEEKNINSNPKEEKLEEVDNQMDINSDKKQDEEYTTKENFENNEQNRYRENIFSISTTLDHYKILSKNFYAGFWLRLVAFVIDILVVASLWGIFNTLTFNKLNKEMTFPMFSNASSISFLIVYFSYFILMTYYAGQTLGKIITRIKVETNKCIKLTWKDVVFREVIGKILSFGLIYLPFLIILFNSKKKGLHDFISDTVVVKEDFSVLRKQINEKLQSINN